MESRVQYGHGALRHHPEARDAFTNVTNHPGTSRILPNALTVILISHVDVLMCRRSRDQDQAGRKGLLGIRPRPARSLNSIPLGDTRASVRAREAHGVIPNLTSVQSGRRHQTASAASFFERGIFSFGERNPRSGKGVNPCEKQKKTSSLKYELPARKY